jgi:DNA-binding NarL/FixJ family response regulator
MVRILIADDHDVVRTGVRSILESERGWEVCGEARNGHEAIDLTRRLKPDIVVLDFFMPRLNGLEAARQILRDMPEQKIIFLTVMDSEETARLILGVGAKGCVLKGDAANDLVVGINAVMRNRTYLTARLSNIVAEYARPHRGCGKTMLELTLREREVIQLVAEGYVTKDVATMLGISVKTAETHRNNAMRKLNIHSVAELVMYAVRNNLVQSASFNWWHVAAA